MYDEEAWVGDVMPAKMGEVFHKLSYAIVSDEVPEPLRAQLRERVEEGLRTSWQARALDPAELGAELGLWPTFEAWLEERDTAARERAWELRHEARTGNDARV
jgi:hypothetical protein